MSKSKYLVVCDGCGMPATVDNPQSFICKNCNYDLCTIQESPVHKDPKEPVIGKECADLLEDLWSGNISGMCNKCEERLDETFDYESKEPNYYLDDPLSRS